MPAHSTPPPSPGLDAGVVSGAMSGRSRIRRVATWALVALYGLVASGLPLPWGLPAGGEPIARTAGPAPLARAPAVLAAKDRSRPFPCMNKPCGCGTAEQCFSSCCCHTPAERLAWARAHRVEPAVIAALERRVALDTGTVTGAASCCTQSAATVGCCSSTAAELLDRPGDHSADDEPSGGERTPRRMKTVSLRAMLACGGLAAEWFAVGGGGLPPPRVEIVPGEGLVAAVGAVDQTPWRPAAPPDVPPPRC